MPDKLSNLTALTSAADDDLLYIVDVSADAGSKSKKITKSNLLSGLGGGGGGGLTEIYSSTTGTEYTITVGSNNKLTYGELLTFSYTPVIGMPIELLLTCQYKRTSGPGNNMPIRLSFTNNSYDSTSKLDSGVLPLIFGSIFSSSTYKYATSSYPNSPIMFSSSDQITLNIVKTLTGPSYIQGTWVIKNIRIFSR